MEGMRDFFGENKEYFLLATLLVAFVLTSLVIGHIREKESGEVAAWYDYSWAYRKVITIQHEQVDADLTDFPVLINLDFDAELAANAQDNGDDIIFTDSSDNTLSHQIEVFDGSTGKLRAWVKADLTDSSDTTINLYYGNSDVGSQENVADVWSNGYVGVWLLNEGSGGTVTDYTGNGNDGTLTNMDPGTDWVEYNNGYALEFDKNNNEFVAFGDGSPITDSTTALSVSASFVADSNSLSSTFAFIGARSAWTTGNWQLYVENSAGTSNLPKLHLNAMDLTASPVRGTTTLNAGQWYLGYGVWNGATGEASIYLDDNLENVDGGWGGTLPESNLQVCMARRHNETSYDFDGKIERMLIVHDVRSTGWVTTEYNNNSSPGTFYELASQEQGDSTPPNNPTSFIAYNSDSQDQELSSGWNYHNQPYFEWSGASDPESGVEGYYLYFGTDDTADPEVTSGIINAGEAVQFQAETNLSVSPAISDRMEAGQTYYFILKTENNADINNISASQTYFTYSYDPTNPSSPEYINVSPTGCSTSNSFDFSWSKPADTGGSQLAKYQYKLGSTGSIIDIADPDSLEISAASYQEGDNVFYLRSVDGAGNSSNWQTAVYCSTGVAQVVDGPEIEAGPSSINVSWTSSKQTTSYVKVYQGNQYVSEQGHTGYSQSHEVDVVGLKPETSYRYKLVWTDNNGNLGESQWYETNTKKTPQVTDLKVETISPTKVLASWLTNYSSSTDIEYGVGSYNQSDSIDGNATSFSKTLNDLQAGKDYQLRVKMTTIDGTEYSSGATFSTPDLPAISNMSYQSVEDAPSATVKVSWQTNVKTSSALTVSPSSNRGKPKSVSDARLKTDHNLTIEGLADQTEYQLVASGRDEYGNQTTSSVASFKTAKDSRPPQISDIKLETSITGTGTDSKAQIVVSWQTDEPATSQVEYGQGVGGSTYQSRTTLDSSLGENHTVIISELDPARTYHLRPVSSDSAGNQAVGSDNVVITGQAQDSVLDIIITKLKDTFGFLANIRDLFGR